MAGTLQFGAVLSWKGFKFDDGGESNKLLVVLGAKAGQNIIAVLTTSQPKHGQLTEGCHAKLGYYFFKAGTYGWKKDTWIQLYRIVEISTVQVLQASMVGGDLCTVRNLPQNVAAAVRNCLKQTSDITEAQKALLE